MTNFGADDRSQQELFNLAQSSDENRAQAHTIVHKLLKKVGSDSPINNTSAFISTAVKGA